VSIVDTMTRRSIPDLLPGTLDMLILRTLQTQPQHGWAIAERIQQISDDVLQVNQGSLYPALHRLEAQGLIDASWELSDKGKRAKYYALTRSGRKQLTAGQSKWEQFAQAIGKVLTAE
jgi:PadR family transcriptional regulator PadR